MESELHSNLVKNQPKEPQILIESDEDSDSVSSDSYELSVQKSNKPGKCVMIKYKSVGNSRHRLGSEDIALKTINQSGKDTRAPIHEGSKNNLLRNAEEKTKSDSQMVNSRTPSKLNQSQTAFNFAVGKCLKPVEEEDKSKSSEKEEFQPFNQEYLFGKEYRESFKKSKYKMMPHKPGQPENISDERCSEGPIARNCVYEFAPRENTVLFKKGTTRPPF